MLDFMMNNPFGNFIVANNLALITPEIILLIVILLCLVRSMFRSEADREQTWHLGMIGTLFASFFLAVLYVLLDSNIGLLAPTLPNRMVWNGMLSADTFSVLIRLLLCLGTVLVLLLSRSFLQKRTVLASEFVILLLSALLGAMLLAGATDVIMLFVALETLGISSYILAGFFREELRSTEASLKYLLYGGASSAVLLFGLSLLYGLSGGHLDFASIGQALQNVEPSAQMLLPIMIVMIVGGFAFKLSAAPFHMWTPDVYEGAPLPVTAFLSVVSKMAGFAITLRFVTACFPNVEQWVAVLMAISVLSMTIGNVAALTQRNVKRLLAYSTIAHAGYLLLGLITNTVAGFSSMVFYLIAYLFMNMGAFASLAYIHRLTGREDSEALSGLVHKRPVLAFTFTVFLLALAGIPITSGFFAKFFLFQALIGSDNNQLWLVIVALLNSTISLYYYLNLVRLMVIGEPSDAVKAIPDTDPKPANEAESFSPVMITLAVCLMITVVMGLFANPFLEASTQSIANMVQPAHAMPTVAQLR